MWIVFVKHVGSLGVINIAEVMVMVMVMVVVVVVIIFVIIMPVVTPRSPSRAHKDLVPPRVREICFRAPSVLSIPSILFVRRGIECEVVTRVD